MFGIIETKHSMARSQQRSISRDVKELLMYYGESQRCLGGANKIYFSKRSFDEIMTDLGRKIFKTCEKFKNTYAIVSDDGVLITIARSHASTMH